MESQTVINRTFPGVTSYDIAKTFAVLFMLVDHIGFFFFPDDQLWRAFGRWCVPVWFFLVGYARSRDTGRAMVVGCLILIAARFVTGMSIFPLNILATIIVIRLILDPLMENLMRRGFWQFSVMFALAAVPSFYATDYGTLGLVMAMTGWLARRAQDGDQAAQQKLQPFFIFAYVAFLFLQTATFAFPPESIAFKVFSAGTAAVMLVLYRFRPLAFPVLSRGGLAGPSWVLRLIGRHTLFIYVAHLVLFGFAAIFLQPERFAWFAWEWFSPTGS